MPVKFFLYDEYSGFFFKKKELAFSSIKIETTYYKILNVMTKDDERISSNNKRRNLIQSYV